MTTVFASIPQHSSPMRRWQYGVFALLGFGLLLVIADGFTSGEPSVAVLPLRDGRRFIIHRLTTGKRHRYRSAAGTLTSFEIWMNHWLSRLGRQLTTLSSPTSQIETATPKLVIWYSFDWSAANPDPKWDPCWLILTDQSGWRTSVNLAPLHKTPAPTPAAPGLAVDPRWIPAELPQDSTELKFELLNSGGRLLVESRIPCPIPQEARTNWSPQPFPIRKHQQEMTVTLTGLQATWALIDRETPDWGDVLEITPEYQVAIDGVESTSWRPMTSGIPLFEPAAEGTVAVATIESTRGAFAPLDYCTVSPHETAWMVHLPMVCQNPHEVAPSAQCSWTRVSFDESDIDANRSTGVGTEGPLKVQLLGAGPAGSFAYEGPGESSTGMPMIQPLNVPTRNRLQGTFESRRTNGMPRTSTIAAPMGGQSMGEQAIKPPSYPMTIRVQFNATRPHLAISWTESRERYPLLIVRDQQGMLLEGDLFNAQGLLIWLARSPLEIPSPVDVTLLVQKPRPFQFFTAPPTVPPR